MDDRLQGLITDQLGLVARRQLTAHHVSADTVRNRVAAGRWVVRTPRVISAFTGDLTAEQRRWLAVLHAGPRSMLGGLTAAAVHGLTGWDRKDITVYVDDELSFEPVTGIDFFRSRRPFSLLQSDRPGIPACRLEPAVLLFAAYDASPRAAHAVLAATVQQRLTTADRLLHWIEVLRPLRRARDFRRTVADIAGGAHSGAELDLRRLCRTFGLAMPDCQRRRTDSNGARRWTDAEWQLDDGRVVILEVDGSYHLDSAQALEDYRRSRRLTGKDRVVVRCTAWEVRHEGAQLAADLIALGIPGRVPENAE
jgi:hypothetical protein